MTDDVVELTERMNRCSPDRSCFLEGTLVETKTGKKAIEEIEEGEEVWCEEEHTGEQKLKKVIKRIEKTNDILYHLYIGNEEIHTTEDHAIWLEGEGWKKAEDVHVGDIVRCRTGEPKKITNVWMEKLPEQVKVYNLSVEDCHNYYVSEKGVLVHNECTGDNTVNIESGNLFNRQKILNGLKNAEVEYKLNVTTGEMEPYMKQYKLNDDYKVLFRRDYGAFNHNDPLGNHWNFEVQTTKGRTVYDLHIYVDDVGDILPITDGDIYIPSKSIFNNH